MIIVVNKKSKKVKHSPFLVEYFCRFNFSWCSAVFMEISLTENCRPIKGSFINHHDGRFEKSVKN